QSFRVKICARFSRGIPMPKCAGSWQLQRRYFHDVFERLSSGFVLVQQKTRIRVKWTEHLKRRGLGITSCERKGVMYVKEVANDDAKLTLLTQNLKAENMQNAASLFQQGAQLIPHH